MKELLDSFNKVFESRIRLGVMAILVVNETMDFNSLKEMLNLTDGNLAAHVANLEKNRYVRIEKEFVGKKTLTTYSATAAGRRAFAEHIDALEKLIKRSK